MEDEAFELLIEIRETVRKHYIEDKTKEPMPHLIADLYIKVKNLLEARDEMMRGDL